MYIKYTLKIITFYIYVLCVYKNNFNLHNYVFSCVFNDAKEQTKVLVSIIRLT